MIIISLLLYISFILLDSEWSDKCIDFTIRHVYILFIGIQDK